MLGALADDLREARTHYITAWQAASEVGQPPVIALAVVGVADLALRLGQYEQAARLLAAGDRVRGQVDRSQPDVARIEQDVREHLGEQRLAQVTQEGSQADWSELVEVTLAS
jgi:hypothetical protein